jgi:hypothetical protein
VTDFQALDSAATAMEAVLALTGVDEATAISAALFVAARRVGAIAQDEAALAKLQDLVASQARELCAIEYARGNA